MKSNKHLFKNELITIFKQNKTPRSYWDSLDEKRKSPKRFKASKGRQMHRIKVTSWKCVLQFSEEITKLGRYFNNIIRDTSQH